ncbi:histone H3-like centromeric protein cid [Drosophila novamexicana]|uniref:histone H3-like centromeric protein cid n=1 Tax=Drosophila novamexicana TaxID=47314 RepID=UPI0011E5EB94|nr:histone H3-like centromeric protein cid [Drosophila novamexicana]
MRPRTVKSSTQKKKKSESHLDNDEDSYEETAFRTPDRENETDYGLEFTTSRLAEMNTSPRRCSTLRKNIPKDHRRDLDTSEGDSDSENQPPAVRQTPRKLPLKTPAASMSKKHQPPLTSRPGSRRKQNKPERRIQKLNREIERLQKHPGFMIPRLPFARLVREIMMKYTLTPFMITMGALEAIHTATEMYITQRFQDAYLLTQYRGRVTLEVRDMALVAYFCKSYGNL